MIKDMDIRKTTPSRRTRLSVHSYQTVKLNINQSVVSERCYAQLEAISLGTTPGATG